MEEAMEVESNTSETRNLIKDYNNFFYATMCHVCKRFGDGVHLQKCSACKMIAYCGQQHQKQHWKQHKFLCKAIQNVMYDYSKENHDVFSGSSHSMKVKLTVLVARKLQRKLEIYEKQMIQFPRECAICQERNDQLLEDCQKCAAVSFCQKHKDNIEHRKICVILQVRLCSSLLITSEESNSADLPYLQHVLNTDTFQSMIEFLNDYADIETNSEMSYHILTAKHSHYLTRPLTLFHAMRLLNYVPERKDLVVHVMATNILEEVSFVPWEILLHLTETVTSLVIIMIGPELKPEPIPLLCKNCMSQEKKLLLEFHNMLYENYILSSFFVKPDLVVAFDAFLSKCNITSVGETWASIQLLAEQNCPFVNTCYTERDLDVETDRMSIMLDRNVDHIYSGKNPFASLKPYRMEPTHLFYPNNYMVVYRSLCA